MTVPFVDLAASYQLIADDVKIKLEDVIASGAFIDGPEVVDFENEFADYCNVAACAGVENGTTAIKLALQALKVGVGDEVIVPNLTYAATAAAVCMTGATPIFIDVLEDTLNLDPDLIEAAITPATKAIIAVHIYGQPAAMTEIAAIAGRHNLKLVEDSAQAHGAFYNGKRAGSLSDIATFSFYPSKNLGALGDGGAVVSNDEKLIEKVKILRNHGQTGKNVHSVFGENARLDSLHAAVLRIKLPGLDALNDQRREVAAKYAERFEEFSSWLTLPTIIEEVVPVWHLYVVRLENRDQLMEDLLAKGIGCGIHYHGTMDQQGAFAGRSRSSGLLDVSHKAVERILSLPMYPGMTDTHIDEVYRGLTEFSKKQ